MLTCVNMKYGSCCSGSLDINDIVPCDMDHKRQKNTMIIQNTDDKLQSTVNYLYEIASLAHHNVIETPFALLALCMKNPPVWTVKQTFIDGLRRHGFMWRNSNGFVFFWSYYACRVNYCNPFIHVSMTPLIASFMGPIWGTIWGRQDPGGPHVGPVNFAIWDNKV